MSLNNPTQYPFTSPNLPSSPGAYAITNPANSVIYIGQTDNLSRRIAEHRADRRHCMHQHAPSSIFFELITAGETARRRREAILIAQFAPICNR